MKTTVLGWCGWCVRGKELFSGYVDLDDTWREPRPIYTSDVRPTPKNYHGIHAVTTGEVSACFSEDSVQGIVRAEPGRVVTNEPGWRAERVSIVALVGLPEPHEALAERYGVPLLWIPEAEALLAESGAAIRVTEVSYKRLWVHGHRLCQVAPPDDLLALRKRHLRPYSLVSPLYGDYLEIETPFRDDFRRLGRAMVARAGLDADSFDVVDGVPWPRLSRPRRRR